MASWVGVGDEYFVLSRLTPVVNLLKNNTGYVLNIWDWQFILEIETKTCRIAIVTPYSSFAKK